MDQVLTWRRRRLLPARIDQQQTLVVAALLAVAAVIETIVRAADDDVFYVLVLCLLALLTTLPMAMPRPAIAAVGVCTANLLSVIPFQAVTVAGVGAQLLVSFRLGRTGQHLLAVGMGLPFLALSLAVALAEPVDRETAVLTIVLSALTPTAALAGAAVRMREESILQRAAHADILGTLLEHTARGERARIARELHDVVAHHVSMIAVQAETARLTTAGMPALGAQRLIVIGDTARSALTEMRRLLGVLRDDSATAAIERQPQPGLHQLNDLLDEARAASGAATRLILYGPPDRLDPGVELAAYRIVQEALTNVRRHAPGAAVDVELRYTEAALMVRVRDNGPGPKAVDAHSAPGHGLLGMHERAAAVGGYLRTGPATGGGFLVESVLPMMTGPRW